MDVQTEAPSAESSQPAEVTQTEAPAENTQTDAPREAVEDGRPSGFDRVEFTPEQKARVDRIYGNMKRYENDSKELREHNQRLINTVNDLIQGQQQIVSHIHGSDYQAAEGRLQEQRETAWEKGDLKKFNDANDRLMEIKTQRILADRDAKAKPQQQQQQPPRGMGAERLVNTAVERGEISPVDTNIAKSWMSETDANGNMKRSWTSEGDPRNYEAALVGKAVFESPAWADKPMAEKLREIDRRMGVQVQQNSSGQNVLGAGNLTRPRQNNNIKLDPKIEDVAVRTKFAGSDPKLTAQDHINAWAKAVHKSQSKQGASRR